MIASGTQSRSLGEEDTVFFHSMTGKRLFALKIQYFPRINLQLIPYFIRN